MDSRVPSDSLGVYQLKFFQLQFLNSNLNEVINTTMYTSHGLICVSFFLYGIRLLHSLTMSKNIGPKFVMIQKMTRDVLTLLAILAIFMLAYGVVSQVSKMFYQSYLTLTLSAWHHTARKSIL